MSLVALVRQLSDSVVCSTVLVSAWKVLHPEKLLSPRQTGRVGSLTRQGPGILVSQREAEQALWFQ